MTATYRQKSTKTLIGHTPRHVRLAEVVLLLACAVLSVGFVRVRDSAVTVAPDFSDLDPADRKAAFFAYLRPLVREVNAEAARDRDFVSQVAAENADGTDLSSYERVRLAALAARYEVEFDPGAPGSAIETLHRRTGTVPASLILIQAAVESGWGTSRFAREGNNLFGQRCYTNGCGIRPRRQSADSRWGVAQFDSIEESLRSYLLNLNTHPEYREFRHRRQEMRLADEPLSGITLAESLNAYSERGPEYVAEIQAMIRQNDLE